MPFNVSVAEQLREGAAALGVPLDADRLDQLVAFHQLLIDPGIPRGVIARGDRDRIVERHILDSLRAVVAIPRPARTAYDLGSGGGLPAIPVSIARRSLTVTSVEPRQNRASFQELVGERIGLPNLLVRQTRAETLEEPVDVCFARALGSIVESWEMAASLLRPGGRLIYFAGASSTDLESPEDAGLFEILPAPALESAGPLVIIGRP